MKVRERERVVCLESRGGPVASLVSFVLEEDLGTFTAKQSLTGKGSLRYECN